MLATVWQILNVMRNDRKRKFSELAETCLAKSVKPQQVNIFLADFSYLKPLQRAAHFTLAVDERCCRAGRTSPKLVETIQSTGPNMPPTIGIVVNVSAKKLWRRVSSVQPLPPSLIAVTFISNDYKCRALFIQINTVSCDFSFSD